MSILDKVKEHPALAVGAIAAVLVIVYVINHSGGATTASTGVDPSQVAAATDLQNAQLAAGAQANQVGAAVQANQDTIAGQIALATIASQQSGAHDALAAGVATSQINADEQVQSLLGSLSADVQKTSLNDQVSMTSIIATNQTQQQQILATALVTQSQEAAQVAINANNNASKSLFDKIF